MKIIETLVTNEIKFMIIAITFLLSLAIIMGQIFKKFKLPTVIGEIIGGILLGPTLFGFLFPNLYNNIFFAFNEEGKVLGSFYYIGLIFLMFVTGYDLNLEFKKGDNKTVIGLLIGSSLIPFIFGFLVSRFFITNYIGTVNNVFIFSILFGLATAITSIPVISKIFIDLDIIDTRFASIMITSATLEDLIEWLILSIILGMATHNMNVNSMVTTFVMTVVVFLFSFFIMPKMFKLNKGSILKNEYIPILFCFIYIAILSLLGVSVMYSALLAGIILKRSIPNENISILNKLKGVAIVTFIPLYFSLVGLRVDLINNFNILRFIIFFVISMFIEVSGIVIVLSILKTKKEAIINFSLAMSARGGPGIVLATVGYEYGIINVEFFTTLVLTSILSSLIAGTWLRFQTKKGKEEFSKVYEGD